MSGQLSAEALPLPIDDLDDVADLAYAAEESRRAGLALVPGLDQIEGPESDIPTAIIVDEEELALEGLKEKKEDDNEIHLAKESIRQYLNEIGEHPLLTAEEEVELAQAMEAGEEAYDLLADTPMDQEFDPVQLDTYALGLASKRKFIESNLRLVVDIATRYHHPGMQPLDHIQNGNLGLIRAIEKFDWRKGFKLSTYATWWIHQAVQRGRGNEGNLIRIPVNRLGEANRAIRTAESNGDEPSAEDVRIQKLTQPESLSTPVSEDGAVSLEDRLPAAQQSTEDEVVLAEFEQQVRVLLDAIPEELWRKDLERKLGFATGVAMTLEETGDVRGVSREAVRQNLKKAYDFLKEKIDSGELKLDNRGDL